MHHYAFAPTKKHWSTNLNEKHFDFITVKNTVDFRTVWYPGNETWYPGNECRNNRKAVGTIEELQLHEALCFYLQRGTSERSSTSHRLFLPICLMYYYSFQIKNGIKKKLEGKSSGCGLEIREYGGKGSVTLTTWHYLGRQAAVARSFGHSVGIVRSRTQATEFRFSHLFCTPLYSCTTVGLYDLTETLWILNLTSK
jgi:hypothetical protein